METEETTVHEKMLKAMNTLIESALRMEYFFAQSDKAAEEEQAAINAERARVERMHVAASVLNSILIDSRPDTAVAANIAVTYADALIARLAVPPTTQPPEGKP